MASAGLGSAYRHLRALFGAGTVVGLSDGALLARYAGSGDEAAFEALVARHGPLVLTTCRAILGNEHDVEDAFQATFLVLARRAGSIRGGEALGAWLHRVAYRAGVRLAAEAGRRRRKEAEASALASEWASRDHAEPDLGPILHEEVDRLPEGHRLAVVLCDLEGLSYEQAAGRLGWTVAALRCRLSRARERLRGRLARRGVTVPAIALWRCPAAVPPAMARSAMGAALGGAASTGAAFLSQAILRGMLMTKLKFASTAALTALALASVGVFAAGAGHPDVPKSPQDRPPSAPKVAEADEVLRVVDPGGKPVAGARVFRSDTKYRSMDHEPLIATPLAETAADGSFRLSEAEAKAALERKSQVVARAEGFGPAFADPSVGDGMKVLRLALDDVPIRGRILDADGRPVAGATVQVVQILWHPSASLDEWLAALEAEKVAYPVQYNMLRSWASDDLPSLIPAVETDREGRFTVKGLGRERIASLLISGPGIETRYEYAATRAMPTVKFPDFDRQNQGSEVTYHGASFDLVAGPGLEVVGTVLDKDTGRPLAGAVVQTAAAFGNPLRFLRTTADEQGRYRLAGIPPRTRSNDDQAVIVRAGDGSPYLPSGSGLDKGPGQIARDFRLKRGIWAKGRVTDKSTGEPVRAGLEYFILDGNPHLKDYPRHETIRVSNSLQADADGLYRVVVIPGPGVLAARFGNDTYRLGVGLDAIKALKGAAREIIGATPMSLIPTNYNTLVEVDPKPGDESVVADIELDRGRTLKGTIVGPGGEPLAGALVLGTQDRFETWSGPLATADFEVHALGTEARRGLLFFHEGKQLAGSYLVRPDEPGPLTVKLEPCGGLVGRLVDEDGRPRAEVQMTGDRPFVGDDSRFERGSIPSPIRTDREGRFRVTGMVPGLKYSLAGWKGRAMVPHVVKDVVVGPGEVKDLGDVKGPPGG